MAMRWPDDQKSSKFYAKGQLSENKGKNRHARLGCLNFGLQNQILTKY